MNRFLYTESCSFHASKLLFFNVEWEGGGTRFNFSDTGQGLRKDKRVINFCIHFPDSPLPPVAALILIQTGGLGKASRYS